MDWKTERHIWNGLLARPIPDSVIDALRRVGAKARHEERVEQILNAPRPTRDGIHDYLRCWGEILLARGIDGKTRYRWSFGRDAAWNAAFASAEEAAWRGVWREFSSATDIESQTESRFRLLQIDALRSAYVEWCNASIPHALDALHAAQTRIYLALRGEVLTDENDDAREICSHASKVGLDAPWPSGLRSYESVALEEVLRQTPYFTVYAIAHLELTRRGEKPPCVRNLFIRNINIS